MPNSNSPLIEQLGRQLGFLRRSCAAYDTGFTDEALRCAVVLRVLFHTTNRQDSLLRQLNAEGIKLLSTCREYVRLPEAPTQVKGNLYAIKRDIFMGLAPVQYDATGARYYAPLDTHKVEIWMPFIKWWKQVVFDFPGFPSITRKIVVTNAANKEGAHVDPHLTPDYEALKISPNLSYVTNTIAEPLRDAHLPALRQISYEVLKSPELTNLVKQGIS